MSCHHERMASQRSGGAGDFTLFGGEGGGSVQFRLG